MIGIALFLSLLACDRPTPTQQALSDALDAWREGSTLLEAGEHADARKAFARGLESHPGNALLMAWDARAAAESGDLDEAIRRSRQALSVDDTFAEARYNLAAYLARKGSIDESGAELRRALADGARPARDVLTDPDFSPHLDHPALEFLPSTGLVVAVQGPDGPVFWGSLGTLTLRISGIDDNPVVIDAPASNGPIELVGVVEDRLRSTDGMAVDLTWTFKAVGAGAVSLGPFEITAGPHKATARGVNIVTSAPEGKETPKLPTSALDFATPTELGGAYEDATAHLVDGGIGIRGKSEDRVEMVPRSKSMVQYELRIGGQFQWMLRHYTGFDTIPEKVTITRNGQTLFDGEPQR